MKILVAVDFSEASGRVLAVAKEYACKLTAELFLIHAEPPEPEFVGYDPGPQSVRDQVAKQIRTEHVRLKEEADRLKEEGQNATALLIQGPIGSVIASEANRLDIDLIIAGSHGHGAFHNALFGSSSGEIIHKTNIPILLVPVKKTTLPCP